MPLLITSLSIMLSTAKAPKFDGRGPTQPPQLPATAAAASSGAADTSGKTEAQIAKIEAKRAAKAAKAAAKGAAKKEKKKAAGLGVGCAELRQRVSPAGEPLAGVEEISRVIDPFRTGDVRMRGICG